VLVFCKIKWHKQPECSRHTALSFIAASRHAYICFLKYHLSCLRAAGYSLASKFSLTLNFTRGQTTAALCSKVKVLCSVATKHSKITWSRIATAKSSQDNKLPSPVSWRPNYISYYAGRKHLQIDLTQKIKLSADPLSPDAWMTSASLTSGAYKHLPMTSQRKAYSTFVSPAPYLASGSVSFGRNKFHKPFRRASVCVRRSATYTSALDRHRLVTCLCVVGACGSHVFVCCLCLVSHVFVCCWCVRNSETKRRRMEYAAFDARLHFPNGQDF